MKSNSSKSEFVLSCKCGNQFQIESESLSKEKPLNYELIIEKECDKCKKNVKIVLYHKGHGNYLIVK